MNTQPVDCLSFKKKKIKFRNSEWQELEVGNIIKVYQGEEFPADCLILDVVNFKKDTEFLVTRSVSSRIGGPVEKKCFEGTFGQSNQRL